MSLLVRLFNFEANQPAIANDVDSEFNQLVEALNGSSLDKNLVTRFSGSDPVYSFDQLGLGPIARYRQSGVDKAFVNNDGSFQTVDQFISTVVTGTPPLVVASTTAVTNLNADLLDGFHQGSFVRDPGGNGLVVRTGVGSSVVRSLSQPGAGLTISNADGVGGNPTFALANDLGALEGLGGTGIAVRTAGDSWAQRSIVGTANQVNVSNGDGVAGNPTLSAPQNIHTGASPTFAGLTLSNDLSVGDDLSVGGTLQVTGKSTFNGNVDFSTTPRILSVPKLIHINGSGDPNVASAEDDLHTFTIPAGTLKGADFIRFYTAGINVSNGNTKTVRARIDGQLINSLTLQINIAGFWEFDILVLRLSSTQVRCFGKATRSSTVSDLAFLNNLSLTVADLDSNDVVFKITGQANGNGDITQNLTTAFLTVTTE